MQLIVSFYTSGHLRGSVKVTTPCVIGRSHEADLPVAHPVLSRNQCTLFEQDGDLYLKDNGSLNGTHFLGLSVEKPVKLIFGDQFSVGSDLIFLITDPAFPRSAPKELADQPTGVFTEGEIKGDMNLATVIQQSPFPVENLSTE